MSVFLRPQEVGRSGGGPAAVNWQDRSVDRTGIFRREKGNGGGQLFRRSDVRGRAGLEKRTPSGQTGLTWHAIADPDGGRDSSRTDRIAANATFSIVEGNTPGQSHYPMLGHRIGRARSSSAQCGLRSGIDDTASTLF